MASDGRARCRYTRHLERQSCNLGASCGLRPPHGGYAGQRMAETAPRQFDRGTAKNRDAQGIPRRWLAIVQQAIISVTPRFSARRMVKEYAEDLYAPAMRRREAQKV